MSIDIPEVMTAELDALLGGATDAMPRVDERVCASWLGSDVIVWEGDAQTFQYTFVNGVAERLLGYPLSRWLGEPTFWADVVVHAHDRDDAVSYCALATARKQHHVFDYRARTADGRIVWFRDYVKVLLGPRNVPQRLRGVMIDVSHLYTDVATYPSKLMSPTREALSSMSA